MRAPESQGLNRYGHHRNHADRNNDQAEIFLYHRHVAGKAVSPPAAKSSELPGRSGSTTRPVSATDDHEQHVVGPEPVVSTDFREVNVNVLDEVEEFFGEVDHAIGGNGSDCGTP